MTEKTGPGDFVRIEFTGKRAADGSVFDTTDAAKAKEAGIFNERYKYGPSLVVVGKGMVVKGLDDALAGMPLGEARKVEIPPEKAFGQRNASLVRVIPLAEFRKRDLEPKQGMVIELDDRPALVRSVTSGRVMVDMNHSLAGEKVVYEVKVTEKVDGAEGKLKALLDENGLSGATVKMKGSEPVLGFSHKAGEEAKHLVAKAAFLRSVKELMPELGKVRFEEEFILAEEKKKE